MTYHRPDRPALDELEALVRNLGEEASAWRRRTLKAEAQLNKLKDEAGALGGPELMESRQRIVVLERENEDLRRRVETAASKVGALAKRLAFLEREAVSEAS